MAAAGAGHPAPWRLRLRERRPGQHRAAAAFRFPMAVAIKVEREHGSNVENGNSVFVDQSPPNEEGSSFRSPGLAQSDDSKILTGQHVSHDLFSRAAGQFGVVIEPANIKRAVEAALDAGSVKLRPCPACLDRKST